jgi:hypothetical protein
MIALVSAQWAGACCMLALVPGRRPPGWERSTKWASLCGSGSWFLVR